jgi:putative transcriptional regulator
MKSSLKERFARLGPVRDIRRVRSGSPVDLVLRPGTDRAKIHTVSATMSLARRGLPMLRAKRVIETMLETGDAVVRLPTVESETALARELREAGVSAKRLARKAPKVQKLREYLQMTQEEFALRYGFSVRTLQNWERGCPEPPKHVWGFLRLIQRDPEAARRAQEEDLQP